MKVAIDARDRAEGDRIKAALDDDVTRAVVNVLGALLPLEPSDCQVVLSFVSARLKTSTPQLPQVPANRELANV